MDIDILCGIQSKIFDVSLLLSVLPKGK